MAGSPKRTGAPFGRFHFQVSRLLLVTAVFRRRSDAAISPLASQPVRGPVSQVPVPSSQRSHGAHGSGAPVQAPPAHVSFVVQALPSSQGFELAVNVQPTVGLHASSVGVGVALVLPHL